MANSPGVMQLGVGATAVRWEGKKKKLRGEACIGHPIPIKIILFQKAYL